ncbi:hypothetical protein H1C71_042396 [Ictidomys tridecemlineatus]|nr:hypothetical protein H1C71_042396 [Ictidomys tridecemlineatus]
MKPYFNDDNPWLLSLLLVFGGLHSDVVNLEYLTYVVLYLMQVILWLPVVLYIIFQILVTVKFLHDPVFSAILCLTLCQACSRGNLSALWKQNSVWQDRMVDHD